MSSYEHIVMILGFCVRDSTTNFTLSSFFRFFMSSYEHIVMILGFCVRDSTAAAHWRCGLKSAGSSPT